MKKRYLLVLIIFFIFSIFNVYAEDDLCNVTINSNVTSFYCGDDDNSNLSFVAGNVVYTDYFSFKKDKISITSSNMSALMKALPKDQKQVKITITSDGKLIGYVTVENANYKEQTTTTTTTTTTVASSKTFTVIFDHNDGTTDKTTRQCQTTTSNGECAVTAPKLENEKFKGWGTKSTCQQGSSGSFKVSSDTTYYACYEKDEEETSSVPYLKSLKMLNQANDEEIDIGIFSVKKNKYLFNVDNSIENIKVVTEVDDNIKVNIAGNTNLKEGENTLTVKLTNEAGEENIYEFTITRLKSGEVVDNKHYLSMLRIQPLVKDIVFDKNQFEYTIEIASNISELNINATPENSTDQVTVIANSNLVNGSSIKINVTGSDGETTIYTLNVVKNSNNNTIILIAAAVIIVLILILTVVVFIKSNSKGNNKPKDTTNSKDKEKTKKAKVSKTKKSKKVKNTPEVLPDSNSDIEILKF